MSVVSANCWKVSGGINPDGERRYTKIYKVETSSTNDGPIAAREAAGIESYGQSYSYGTEADTGSFCHDKFANLLNVDQSRKLWLVTVKFSSSLDEKQTSFDFGGDPIDDPVNRPVQWSGSFLERQEIVEQDRNGNPIVNMAGDLLEGITEDFGYPELLAERNLAAVNLAVWAEYSRGVVNSDTWLGLLPRRARCRNITWRTARAGPFKFFVVTYRFLINEKGWDRDFENRGYRQIKTIGAEPTKIPDITEPEFLDANGKRLSKADKDAGNFHTIIGTEILDEKPFADLGLPSTIEA